MKNNQEGKLIDYEQCRALTPFSENLFHHQFIFEKMLDGKVAVFSSAEPIKSKPGIGFIWHDDGEISFANISVSNPEHLKKGCKYSVFYKISAKDSNLADLDSAIILNSDEWLPEKPVKQMMQSWRLKFLGIPLINKLYHSYGEQALLMIIHNELDVARHLNLDAKRMLILSNEARSLLQDWHKISFFMMRGLKLTESEMIVDVLNSHASSDKAFNPFSLLRVRDLSKDLQHRYFDAMGIYEKCKSEFNLVLTEYFDVLMGRSGETAIELEKAIAEASRTFSVSKAKVERTIHKMIASGEATYRRLYGEDTISTGKMLELDSTTAEILSNRVDDFFEQGESIRQFLPNHAPDGKLIELSDEQMVAIQTAISTHTCVITGGPGTGKTTTINALIKELSRLNPSGKIHLAAPTGKAARRMSEVTGHLCMTLHRMMGMTPDSSPVLSSFGNDDTLILDEASMMDINILCAALMHTGNRGRVIFIGDPKQIPSIDTGAILNDVILCRQITVAELLEVQRQAAKSDIVAGAYAVLKGKVPDFSGPGGDLHFIEANSPMEVLSQIKELVDNVIPHSYQASTANVQILAAMRKGESGVNKINEKLKQIFNPNSINTDTPYRALGHQIYHVGDRVMQLQNRYDLDIQNGEVGDIASIDEKNRKIWLNMGDRFVALPYENYPFMTHAWGMTVHKSQGSEYDFVIIAMPNDHEFMLYKKLLFTAMTRGKKHVFIVSSKQTLEFTVKDGKMTDGIQRPNKGNRERLTHLPFLLSEQICDKSNHSAVRKMAENSRKIAPPDKKYSIDVESIVVPF